MSKRTLLSVTVVMLATMVLGGSTFTVRETETAILTQFGRMVGEPISEPGLHFKLPMVQTVNLVEKRMLEWDGPATEMPTKDKTYIEVDTFARWRVADAGRYFVSLTDERSAHSRLDDIIGSEVRAAVASHELIEVIRSDKGRALREDPQKKGSTPTALPVATRGRLEIE